MKRLILFLMVSLSVLLSACFDSPPSPSSNSNSAQSHFLLQYPLPEKALAEVSRAAQSGQPFTATLRVSYPEPGLEKISTDSPEVEIADIHVRFTGSEYLVQDPSSEDWVTLTQVLAEEAADEVGVNALAKVAVTDEPLELPEKTATAEQDNTDVIILAGTLTAGTGVILFKAAKWGWKKLFGKKKPKIKDPGVHIDKKIKDQMQARGWDEGSVQETIKNPHKTAQAIDRTSNNEPATAYFNKEGHHVVRNDKTGRVVQVSNKNDPNWKPDQSFKD